jgi:fatty-acyl-CoA synthase
VAFDAFLDAQRDLGTKWSPRFVRLVDAMALTANNKVNKRPLRTDAWECADPVWWRPERGAGLVPMTADDRASLRAQMAEHGRLDLLG